MEDQLPGLEPETSKSIEKIGSLGKNGTFLCKKAKLLEFNQSKACIQNHTCNLRMVHSKVSGGWAKILCVSLFSLVHVFVLIYPVYDRSTVGCSLSSASRSGSSRALSHGYVIAYSPTC